MTGPLRKLLDLMFPIILIVFVTLYVSGLVSGAEPELALARAGAASLILAVLTRVATAIAESASRPHEARPDAESSGDGATGRHVDVAIGDEAPAPSADHPPPAPFRTGEPSSQSPDDQRPSAAA